MRQSEHKVVAILAFLFAASTLLFPPNVQAAGDAPAPIRFHSRTFTPASGVDPSVAAAQATTGGAWHGIVQFNAIPNRDERAALDAMGVTLLGYVPETAWLATLPADVTALAALPNVRWIGALQPADKLDPFLAAGTADWAITPTGAYRLVVDFFADVEAGAGAARVGQLGGAVERFDAATGQLHVTLPAAALWALAAEDGVRWLAPAEPAKETTNNLAGDIVNAFPVQNAPYSLSGAGVQAGIWDNGVVDTHPDFTGRLTQVSAEGPNWHATHVAGTLGGDGSASASQGGAPFEWRGMAPGAHIYSYHWVNLINSMGEAIDSYGIDVASNSWAYSCSLRGIYALNAPDYDEMINGKFSRTIPILFSAANMGNGNCGGSPYGTVSGGPPSAKNVLTVGATSGTDGAVMYGSSSRGPTKDGRLKPEVVAPGTGIMSTTLDGAYIQATGTSMATPVVAGGIALMLERYQDVCPNSGDLDGNPLPATTRALIAHTATDLVDGAVTFPGPDYTSGYGLLNVEKAVETLPYHVESSLDQGQTQEFTLQVAQQASLKITLAWDDVPAEDVAAITLVNNLDLSLVAPDGTVHLPWALDPLNPGAAATTGVDNLNVIEQVFVTNPLPGAWTVRVTGANIPTGPQAFALVGELLPASSCGAPATDIWLDDAAPTGNLQGWSSSDIWVRHAPDPDLTFEYQHQNPEHGQTNYIFVKVRNAGQQADQTAHSVQVMAYWATDQSSGPAAAWPVDWQFIGSDVVADVAPGSDGTAVIPWEPPAPADRTYGETFSLYVRLVSFQDPSAGETSDAAANVDLFNHIDGKDTVVVDLNANPGEIPTAVGLAARNAVSTSLPTNGLILAFAILLVATIVAEYGRRRHIYTPIP